jgi:hypothetical protein
MNIGRMAAAVVAPKAVGPPRAAMVEWLVDGAAVGTSNPALPFHWAMTPGTHRLQVRLPLAPVVSRAVRVMVKERAL